MNLLGRLASSGALRERYVHKPRRIKKARNEAV